MTVLWGKSEDKTLPKGDLVSFSLVYCELTYKGGLCHLIEFYSTVNEGQSLG